MTMQRNDRSPELRRTAGRHRRRPLVGTLIVVLGLPLVAIASPVSIPHDFASGDTIIASEFNENFAALADAINDNDERLSQVEMDVTEIVSDSAFPTGAVVFFDSETCPMGWSELTAMRGRVPLGLPGGGLLGDTVGTDLPDGGLRTISQVPSHSHTVDPPNTNTSSGGTHNHPVDPPGTPTTNDGSHIHSVNPPSTGTSSDGSHTHVVNNGNGGAATGYLQAANSAGDGAVPDSSAPIFPAGNHTHTVNIGAFNSASGGSHIHTVDVGSFNSGNAGSHLHSVNISAFSSSSAGVANVDVTMPYMQLLACSKD